MNNKKTVLEIKNARKSFDGVEVLKDISVSVNDGNVLAVIGPSGSGKSTLLRCATLLEKLDGGEIRYGSTDENTEDIVVAQSDKNGNAVYSDKSSLQKARSLFGLVFQNFNLFPHYSVLKNIVDAPIHVQKREKSEVIEEAMILLKKMGLDDRCKAYPQQLSGGQQQRVSIARALAMNPKILFFDEPTSALDPELTGDILKTIRSLAAEHMTMVIVTHEIDFARNVADKVVFMADGVIVEEGSPEEVIDNPKNERTRMFLSKLSR